VGEINVTFRSLKKEVNDFLKEFDKDGNEEIDVKELVDKRELLFKPWHEIQSDNIPQTQTHEYVIPIEKQFYEQFAQTHQKETFSF
jgi:hypothetical protein